MPTLVSFLHLQKTLRGRRLRPFILLLVWVKQDGELPIAVPDLIICRSCGEVEYRTYVCELVHAKKVNSRTY